MTGDAARMTPKNFSDAEVFADYFRVSRETIAALEDYEDLLRRWQPVQNLVAANSLDAIWHRHFADSAQLLSFIEFDGTIVDLGSGAGFPGLVLAILRQVDSAAEPSNAIHLVESNARKCSFMRDVARRLGLSVSVHATRIERFAASAPVSEMMVAAVVSRALAPLPKLLELAFPLFSEATVGVFLKGRGAADEVAQAQTAWQFRHRLHQSVTDLKGRIVELKALKSEQGRLSP